MGCVGGEPFYCGPTAKRRFMVPDQIAVLFLMRIDQDRSHMHDRVGPT